MSDGHARPARCVGWFVALLCGWAVADAQTEGTLRWAYTTTLVRNAYIASSPAIGPNGAIYFGVAEDTRPPRGRLVALTSEAVPKWAGAVREGFVTTDLIEATPTIGEDGTVYFGCWNGIFFALDGETGSKKWEFNVDDAKDLGSSSLPAAGFIVSAAALGSDGTLYFGSGDALHPELGAVHAVRNGNERWRYVTGANVETDVALGSDGTVYFGAADGWFYALNQDGTLKWRQQTGAALYSSPAIGADGTIYVGTLTQGLWAFTPAGAVKWTFPTGSISGGASIGPDGTIYVGSFQDWLVHAVREPDADHPQPWRKWAYDAERPVSSTPVVRGDGVVIVGLDRNEAGIGGVVAINPDTGTRRWFYSVNENVSASPLIDPHGRIYVGGYDRKLHSIWGNNSRASSFSPWPMMRRDARRTARRDPPLTGGRLINLSTRAAIDPEKNLIAGFVVLGSTTKYYLVRAVGPGLAPFNVSPPPLGDPTVTVYSGSIMRAGNNDWEVQTEIGPDIAETAGRVGAFPLASRSADAAVLPLLEPGLYTALVGIAQGGSGSALVEVYDAVPEAPGSLLVNLSTRGPVTAAAPLLPGLVVRGSQPVRVLVRVAGPTLGVFGVTGVLAQPRMEVIRQSDNATLRVNQGWTSDGWRADILAAGAVVGAFPFPDGSADSAALLELAPGDYTIRVTGANGGAGEVLVEVYLVP